MGPVYFLLVDDHKENFIPLEALLKRENLVLLKANSGVEALELLLQHEVALALIDIQMPGMNGFELAEIMRSNERTKTVPIIFVTAGETNQSRRFRGYEAGAVDFITKPIEPDILKSKANVFFQLYLQHLALTLQRDKLEATLKENEQLLKESRLYAEVLKLTNDRKNEFLATLGHELRNPLTPLRVGLDILQKNPEPETCAKVHTTMARQLDYMVSLIDDLLDMSRVSEGKIKLNCITVNLQEALDAALDSCMDIITLHQHTVTRNISDEVVWINADPIRLEQIIANLLNNAAKYTPEGGKLSLTIKKEGQMGVLAIADNGVGIPEDMINTIFDLFTQVDYTNNSGGGGLGIGLSLVKKLLDLHGGEITAKSEGPGKGSTFTIYLPIAEPAKVKEDDSPAITEPKAEPENEQGLHILIVDDNVPAAQTMGMMIELEGHDTSLAYNGIEALDLARKSVPDIILLDISLPGMNGFQVAETLRKDSRFDECLLIAQTGWGRDCDMQAASDAGFDHFLVKPLNLKTLQPLLKPRHKVLSADTPTFLAR